MLNDKERSEIDQSFAFLADNYPPALHRFYKNLVVEGFLPEQAMYLTEVFLKQLCTTKPGT